MTLFLLNSQKHNSLRSRNLAVLATLSYSTLWSVNKTSPSVSSKFYLLLRLTIVVSTADTGILKKKFMALVTWQPR